MANALLIPENEAWRELALAARDHFTQIASRSRRIYTLDMKVFVAWMLTHELTPITLTRSAMIAYQAYLLERYARATAARMIATVRSVLKEWSLVTGNSNPAVGLRPIKTANETTHVALSKPRARALLRAIDRGTLLGLRNYALILLLLRTGIRRAECAALQVGDLRVMDGHKVAVIRHGKEDKRRIVKIPHDVFKAIETYMATAWRVDARPEEPLFVQIRKGGHVQEAGLGTKAIERLVKELGLAIGEPDLRPHGLRATFITLALESEAPLEKVQFAAGHARPETTLRYQKRKLNLDDNAVDYLHDVQA